MPIRSVMFFKRRTASNNSAKLDANLACQLDRLVENVAVPIIAAPVAAPEGALVFPRSIGSVLRGTLALKPFAVIELGLLLLIATPVFRVAAACPVSQHLAINGHRGKPRGLALQSWRRG